MNKRRFFNGILFLTICMCLNAILCFVLIPPSYVKLSLHKLVSKERYDYIFVGTSHGQYGIDPEVIERVTKRKSLNLCMADQYPIDTYYLIKEALRTQKPKKIVYEVDSSYWMTDQRIGSPTIFIYKELSNSWNKLEYWDAKILSKNYRATLFPWVYYRNLYPDIKKHISTKLSEDYQNFNPNAIELPQCQYQDNGFIFRQKLETDDKGTYNNIPWNEAQIKKEAVHYFKKMVKLCKKENVELDVIITPVPQETIQNMPEKYEQADQYFSFLTKELNVKYKNFNYLSKDDLDRSINGYWDYDGHMYGKFAGEFSKILGRYIENNMDRGIDL
ncbi:hypothetical protein ACTQ6A_05640 [Lachnospiraceae bacterium LCP25S3_G4]